MSTAMYGKGKSDGYDFATTESQKEINKIRVYGNY